MKTLLALLLLVPSLSISLTFKNGKQVNEDGSYMWEDTLISPQEKFVFDGHIGNYADEYRYNLKGLGSAILKKNNIKLCKVSRSQIVIQSNICSEGTEISLEEATKNKQFSFSDRDDLLEEAYYKDFAKNKDDFVSELNQMLGTSGTNTNNSKITQSSSKNKATASNIIDKNELKEQLTYWKSLLDDELITQEDYNYKKNELLNSLGSEKKVLKTTNSNSSTTSKANNEDYTKGYDAKVSNATSTLCKYPSLPRDCKDANNVIKIIKEGDYLYILDNKMVDGQTLVNVRHSSGSIGYMPTTHILFFDKVKFQYFNNKTNNNYSASNNSNNSSLNDTSNNNLASELDGLMNNSNSQSINSNTNSSPNPCSYVRMGSSVCNKKYAEIKTWSDTRLCMNLEDVFFVETEELYLETARLRNIVCKNGRAYDSGTSSNIVNSFEPEDYETNCYKDPYSNKVTCKTKKIDNSTRELVGDILGELINQMR